MTSGVLVLNKPAGMTSHDAVMRVRRLYHTKKVGHTGTLDPGASGVLTVLIGNAVKTASLLEEKTKIYHAGLRFGTFTDTEDIWGKVLQSDPHRPTEAQICEALGAFQGDLMQTPPMVSAIKVGGKKLYELARRGEVIERTPRPITVHSFTLLDYSPDRATFRIEVSRGAYIRTLLYDLCCAMGVLGVMDALEREASGSFFLSSAVTPDQLECMSDQEREKVLIPIEALFTTLPAYHLPPFFDRLIASGQRVLLSKLHRTDPVGTRFRLYRDGVFFAVGEVIEEDGEKKLFKIKEFPLDH